MRIPLKPVRTSGKEIRSKRDNEIVVMYKVLMSINGSQRTAVANHVANERNMTYANVMKITKNITLLLFYFMT